MLRDCFCPSGISLDKLHAPILLIWDEKDEISPADPVSKSCEACKDAAKITELFEFSSRGTQSVSKPIGKKKQTSLKLGWQSSSSAPTEERALLTG